MYVCAFLSKIVDFSYSSRSSCLYIMFSILFTFYLFCCFTVTECISLQILAYSCAVFRTAVSALQFSCLGAPV